MSTQPQRASENDTVDEDLKCMLDENAAAAERDNETFSRRQIREGAAKLKRHAPQ